MQRGFKIAAISIDEGSPEDVIAFASELGLTFDILHDRDGVVQQQYQTTGVPESFLLDRRGHPGQAGDRRARLGLARQPEHGRPACSRQPGIRYAAAPAVGWLSGSWASRPPATRPPPPCCAPKAGGARSASLVILSQDVHRIFGGVVPELASRAHVQAIGSVVERALADAGIGQSQLDGVVVTAGPGLVGALLVGRDVREDARLQPRPCRCSA